MIGARKYAYGNARVRARKSRLLGPDDAASLLDRDVAAGTLHALADDTPLQAGPSLVPALFARLAADYKVVIESYPSARELWLALG